MNFNIFKWRGRVGREGEGGRGWRERGREEGEGGRGKEDGREEMKGRGGRDGEGKTRQEYMSPVICWLCAAHPR